tara:strand:- start:523 stop:867 length:345 start_codon:yes stop_codon:yes gene_type:complete
MLKIEAIFRPERINVVTDALTSVGVTGFHYQNITGQGEQQGVQVITSRGSQTATRASVSKTLLVTIVSDDIKDKVVNAIIESTRSGEIGDGKIFISEIADIIRVRTGETGEEAI